MRSWTAFLTIGVVSLVGLPTAYSQPCPDLSCVFADFLPENLVCTATASTVELSWEFPIPFSFESIIIDRSDGESMVLAGDATSYTDSAPLPGTSTYLLSCEASFLICCAQSCDVDSGGPCFPVQDLVCQEIVYGEVNLSWTNGQDDYDEIHVLHDGNLVTILTGSTTGYVALSDTPYDDVYTVIPYKDGVECGATSCDAIPLEVSFFRGDSNSDGMVTIADVIFSLAFSFQGGPPPVCEDSADGNDDGTLDINDPIFVVSSLFVPGSQPIPPPTTCDGPDPTLDTLSCALGATCP